MTPPIPTRALSFRVCAPAAAFVAIALASAGCGGRSSAPADAASHPSVIVVSLDTLRSDRIGAYGATQADTPALDAFAASAIRFERAYSTVPMTLPAHATLFTGRLPPEHGVRDNRGYRLDDALPTLAERFRSAGYVTAGFVSSMVLRGDTGIARGFDHWDEPGGSTGGALPQRRGDETVERVVRWFDAGPGGDTASVPAFLFVHLFDPHTPYAAPEPYASAHDHPYDAEVAWTDALVGRLFDALRERGVLDRAWVVVLSDHGEGLGDHGESEHGLLLYREALQVPLIVRPAGDVGARVVDAPVSLAELAGTIARGVGVSADGFAGRDLLGSLDGGDYESLYSETWLPKTQYGLAALRSIVRGELHYIDGPRPELYDVVADPAERNDLAYTRDPPPPILDTLVAIGEGRATDATIDDEERRQLASLGYVGGGSAGVSEGNPVDHVEAIETLWGIVDGDVTGVPDGRVVELLAALAEGNEALHRAVVRALLDEGRIDFADRVLAPFAESGEAETLSVAGLVHVAAGRPARAERAFRAATAASPALGEPWFGLGVVAFGAGDWAEALASLERATTLDPGHADAWNGLGVARARTGDPEGASIAWTRAVELDPELADAWFNLAAAARDRGALDETAAALSRYAELVDGPDRARALAILESINRPGPRSP